MKVREVGGGIESTSAISADAADTSESVITALIVARASGPESYGATASACKFWVRTLDART